MKRTSIQNNEIVERIKLIIKEKNINQKQLQELTDINQTTLSKYFNCKLPVGDSLLYALTCIFFINPLWLENGEGDVYLSPSISTEIKKTDIEDVKMSREVFNVIADQAAAIRSQQHIIHNYIEGKIDKNCKSCI